MLRSINHPSHSELPLSRSLISRGGRRRIRRRAARGHSPAAFVPRAAGPLACLLLLNRIPLPPPHPRFLLSSLSSRHAFRRKVPRGARLLSRSFPWRRPSSCSLLLAPRPSSRPARTSSPRPSVASGTSPSRAARVSTSCSSCVPPPLCSVWPPALSAELIRRASPHRTGRRRWTSLPVSEWSV